MTGEGVQIDRSISPALARRILALVLGGPATPGSDDADAGPGDEPSYAPAPAAGGKRDAAAFLASKKPTTDIEKIACLAYVLTHHRGIQRFKTKDLTKAVTDARTSPFSNPTQACKNAARAQYLAPAGNRTWLLTTCAMLAAIRASLASSYPAPLVEELLAGYREAKERFYQGGLRLSEVEGGRFCEAAFRILQHRAGLAVTPVGAGFTLPTDSLILQLQNFPKGSHLQQPRRQMPGDGLADILSRWAPSR